MFYRNFGFHINSDVELPFWAENNPVSKADIVILKSMRRPELTDPIQRYTVDITASKQLVCYVADHKNSLIMDFENYVCFHYINDNDKYYFYYYFYDEYPIEWKERLISRFGIAYLLSWMGITVLHGSAVCDAEKAICFIADSNGGKSSVAGLFVANGWLMMADELVVLKPEKGEISLFPSSSYLHLSDESLNKIVFNHYLVSPIEFQFRNDFMDISESTNRVDLRTVTSLEECKCQKIILLERGHDGGVAVYDYKKADAYMTLLQYLYTPIIFPAMRKNLMALIEPMVLKRMCFSDCFIQFQDIEKICKGELA